MLFHVRMNVALLTALPLFPYMQIKVTPLCRHPSSIRNDDR